MKLFALALLVASSSALRVRDLGDLELPTLTDENDVAIDKKLAELTSSYKSMAKNDQPIISSFEKTLQQAHRNAEQGDMGRALALSKLTDIKQQVNILEQNLKSESQALVQQTTHMMQKHRPTQIDSAPAEEVSKKAKEVMAQIPKINSLEKMLEV